MRTLVIVVGLLIGTELLLFGQTTSADNSAKPAATQSDAEELIRARHVMEQGEIGKAVTILRSIEARNEQLKGLDHELGIAYYRQSDYLRASVYFEKAIALDAE